jgi:hypothetical protein
MNRQSGEVFIFSIIPQCCILKELSIIYPTLISFSIKFCPRMFAKSIKIWFYPVVYVNFVKNNMLRVSPKYKGLYKILKLEEPDKSKLNLPTFLSESEKENSPSLI